MVQLNCIEVFSGSESCVGLAGRIGATVLLLVKKTFYRSCSSSEEDIGVVVGAVLHVFLGVVVAAETIESICGQSVFAGRSIGNHLVDFKRSVPCFSHSVGCSGEHTVPAGKECGILKQVACLPAAFSHSAAACECKHGCCKEYIFFHNVWFKSW